MSPMLTFVFVVVAFAVFEVLVVRHGAESRPVFDERPERGRVRII